MASPPPLLPNTDIADVAHLACTIPVFSATGALEACEHANVPHPPTFGFRGVQEPPSTYATSHL